MKRLVHCAGRAYCGKSVACQEVARQIGATVVSIPDEIRRVAMTKHAAVSRAILASTAERLRSTVGVAGMLNLIVPSILSAPTELVLVDGTNFAGDLAAFRHQCAGMRMLVILIEASIYVRVANARQKGRDEIERSMTIQQLLMEDIHLFDQSLNMLESRVHAHVTNDGTDSYIDDIIRHIETWTVNGLRSPTSTTSY